MYQQQQLILSYVKHEFEQQRLHQPYQQNVWIMAATIIPFAKSHAEAAVARDKMPTHTARLVLRTTDEIGTNDFVDGTDLYVDFDNASMSVLFVWEDLWAEGPPIFHGGTVPDALRWVSELAEPFYIQLKDPFLTTEQRIALNGHDGDYLEPEQKQWDKKSNAKPLTDDDFNGLF